MKTVQSGLAVVYRFVNWIIQLPRLTRIALAAVFALALTLVITPLVDEFYIANFYDVETREAPALFSTALGVVFYLLGWRLIIGFAGEAPAANRAVAWYLGVGALACALVVILVVFGAISGTII
jgi:hypothetical protein